MTDDRYQTDPVLIVYPQERFALQAIERFEACGLSCGTIEPPAHLLDVACPAGKVSRSLFGEVQEVSKKEGLFHLGIVDWRAPAPDADRIERPASGSGPFLLEIIQITFIAPCMADDTKLRFHCTVRSGYLRGHALPERNGQGRRLHPGDPNTGLPHGACRTSRPIGR